MLDSFCWHNPLLFSLFDVSSGQEYITYHSFQVQNGSLSSREVGPLVIVVKKKSIGKLLIDWFWRIWGGGARGSKL